jgi:S-formylglutathione hydrolase FrmB
MNGVNDIEVLLPDDYDARRQYRVLYVLPVESGVGGRYGDGLLEVRKANAHNRYQLICVAIAFDTLPWYGAHATAARIRHEDYILKVAVPLIESRYSTRGTAEGRLLLGFSKSGWGALTLLFRNPEFFGYACSWDAPLMMDENDLGAFGTGGHFGTKQQFRQYLPTRLIDLHAVHFRVHTRIALLGHQSFGPNRAPAGQTHTNGFHLKLESLRVKHQYDNTLRFKHDWRSGWVPPAIGALMKIAGSATEPA